MTHTARSIIKISAFALLACLIGTLPVLAASKTWVQVTRKAGLVESKLASSQNWLRIPNNRRLGVDDSVRTNEEGKAHLKLADNSVVALNPSTSIVLREFVLTANQRSVSIDLEKGQLRTQVSQFNGSNNRYQIKSPNAVMAAQGTDFSVTFINDNSAPRTILRVHNGTVHIQNLMAAQFITVNAGQAAVVTTNQAPQLMSVGEANSSFGEEKYDLPEGGDADLQAVDSASRGTMGSTHPSLGINSMGTSGDSNNSASPVVPDTPQQGDPTTGSVIIDIIVPVSK